MTSFKEQHLGVVPYDKRRPAPVDAQPVLRAETHNYNTTCKIVVTRRDVMLELPEGAKIEVGLLTAAPTPEGTRVVEPTAKNYKRQPSSFAPMRPGVIGSSLQNTEALSFGPVPLAGEDGSEGWAAIKNVGVFVDDKLTFYGLMTRALVDEGGEADRHIRFSAKALSLSFK